MGLNGGSGRDRTDDQELKRQLLYLLSYGPTEGLAGSGFTVGSWMKMKRMVGVLGLEPRSLDSKSSLLPLDDTPV